VRIEEVDLNQLSAAEEAAWWNFQNSCPGQGGPFQTLTFAKLTQGTRGDAACIAFYSDERSADFPAGFPLGYFVAQRMSAFRAMPIGAPINDMNGFVGDPTLALCPKQICEALKVGRIDFTHAPEEQRLFADHSRGAWDTYYANLTPGRDAFMAALKKRRAKFVYHIGRQGRQMARERGETVFTAGSRNRRHLEQLLAWKTEQLIATNQPPVWRRSWLRRLVLDAFTAEARDFGGVLFTLTIGDHLIAANYCLRGPRALQGLLMCHDDAFEHYSPGKQLGLRVIEWATENGFDEMHFGPGESLFKRQLSTHSRRLHWGYLGRPSFSAAVRGAQYKLREEIERAPVPWIAGLPGRAMRRFDLHSALNAPHAKAEIAELDAFDRATSPVSCQ
jgi:CelD/BcsL family acetyltransferase involved in cellulose biosynthesis